ncbi:MAG: tetraacyldisaccharide 4'-kinase [Gammaproteobacteria bacterium]
MSSANEFFEKLWYSSHPLGLLLVPVAWCYALVIIIRRLCYQSGIFAINHIDAPVIVVGNITVGGTGKTPLVLWLVDYFRKKGLKPGVISRGYGGYESDSPQQVRPDSNPLLVGDEPVLIARNTLTPVAVAKERRLAAEELIKHYKCNLIICDDGLQHYGLGRDIEICVIDGQRRFGNERCLPAGPLREPLGRLHSVDMIVSKYKAARHEYKMDYTYGDLVSLKDNDKIMSIKELEGQEVHAVAGIGNPERFFAHLRNHNVHVIKHVFPDHHPFKAEDITFHDGLPVVMTEKDAVKCLSFANRVHWYLPIKASLPEAFSIRLDNLMKEAING